MKKLFLLISCAAILSGVNASASAAGSGDGKKDSKKPSSNLSTDTSTQSAAAPVQQSAAAPAAVVSAAAAVVQQSNSNGQPIKIFSSRQEFAVAVEAMGLVLKPLVMQPVEDSEIAADGMRVLAIGEGFVFRGSPGTRWVTGNAEVPKSERKSLDCPTPKGFKSCKHPEENFKHFLPNN